MNPTEPPQDPINKDYIREQYGTPTPQPLFQSRDQTGLRMLFGRVYPPPDPIDERRDNMRKACLKAAVDIYIDLALTLPYERKPEEFKNFEQATDRIVDQVIRMAERLLSEEAGKKE